MYILQSQTFLSLASKIGYFGSSEIGFQTYDENGPSRTMTSRNTIIVDIKARLRVFLDRRELSLLAALRDADLHARWDKIPYE